MITGAAVSEVRDLAMRMALYAAESPFTLAILKGMAKVHRVPTMVEYGVSGLTLTFRFDIQWEKAEVRIGIPYAGDGRLETAALVCGSLRANYTTGIRYKETGPEQVAKLLAEQRVIDLDNEEKE